jgi:hypothetical protein
LFASEGPHVKRGAFCCDHGGLRAHHLPVVNGNRISVTISKKEKTEALLAITS